MRDKLPYFFCFLMITAVLGAQDREPLPDGFRSLKLGMEMEAAKEALEKDSYFLYEGAPDVSLLPSPDSSIIECEGYRFINEGIFQFYEENLYIIILHLNPEELDYFSMYTAFTEKYGPPVRLDPEQVLWENDTVRFSLERPLTVKYIDWETFSKLREESRVEESYRATSRKEFIDLF